MLLHKGNNIWLNGSFDVLHTGHIKLLRYARMLAGQHGTVWVGLDDDDRISSRKGPSRPINTLKDRMLFLSSIKYIDVVVPFASDDELKHYICEIEPDFMLIGDDYRDKPIIGSDFIKEIIYITRDGKSTSDIVDRIYG
jgi:D-beta-D-heptose 7-phosphate kinase/D-beta-D-heptose 1-phosphate adenosyltransferase